MNALKFPIPFVSQHLLSLADEPTQIDKLVDILTVLAPLLILAVGGIIAYYVYTEGRSKKLSGAILTECKREIVNAMRQKIAGLTIMEVAKIADVTREQAEEILAEMKADNQVYQTKFRGKEVWCLKGLGEGNLYM